MKYVIFLSGLCLLLSCQKSTGKDIVPDSVKSQIDTVYRLHDACFNGFPLWNIWDNREKKIGDSIFYYFKIPCFMENSKHKVYPFPYRCIVLNDTLIDVQYLAIIKDQYESIYPPVYNPKTERWWKEITSYQLLNKVEADKIELKQLENSDWVELYYGNVRIQYDSSFVECDSFVYNPILREIRIPGMGKYSREKDSKISILIGENWVLGLDELRFRIEKPLSESIVLDSTLISE